jgi:hypothetical protein
MYCIAEPDVSGSMGLARDVLCLGGSSLQPLECATDHSIDLPDVVLLFAVQLSAWSVLGQEYATPAPFDRFPKYFLSYIALQMELG